MSVAHFNMYHTFSSLKSLYLPVVFIHSLDADNGFFIFEKFLETGFYELITASMKRMETAPIMIPSIKLPT